MTKKMKLFLELLIVASLLLAIGCDAGGSDGNGAPPTTVTFESAVSADGSDGAADTTELTLTFSVDPTTLTSDNITITGATKGKLSGTGLSRSLAISEITVANGEPILIAIVSPNGYTINGSPRPVIVYKETKVAVSFESVIQSGGVTGTVDSSALILTFSINPTTLTADNITVTGATKGVLGGIGTTRTLAISNITVANGETVSVTISSPSGFTISGSPKTAVVYKAPYIGMAYQGGIIAYFFQSGDPGYISGETHGLIASTTNLGDVVSWDNGINEVTGATGTALGTGQANTIAIVNSHGSGNYAAKLCDEYINVDTGTGVYSDWYLPSKDELYKLYLNRSAIGGFSYNPNYWSSSETAICNACVQDFATGGQYNSFGKDLGERVRAIRYF